MTPYFIEVLLSFRLPFFRSKRRIATSLCGFFMSKNLQKLEKEATTEQLYCHRCGTSLTEENSREVSTSFSSTGVSHWCLSCEQNYFDQLTEKSGRHLALFFCCITFHVPCKPIVLEGTSWEQEKDGWIFYIDRLAELGEDRKGSKVLSFFDGETDLLRIFGREMSQKDFAKYILVERRRIDSLPGTPEQREKWGVGAGYTDEIYNELDRLYAARASSYVGQTITPQMEDTLIKTAKWNYKIDKLVEKGAFKAAKDLQSMVDSVLSSEQMRKKDEKPVEAYSIDAQVIALERAGLMEQGKFLKLDALQKVLVDNFFKAPKYDYSIDVVDHSLEAINRTMRLNADLFVPTEVPAELKVDDDLEECEPEETPEEVENKRFAGMAKITYTKENRGEQEREGAAGEKK